MKKNLKDISKIHIVGIYGSGKTNLANRLSKILNIKKYDLDDIKYKRKYDIIRPVDERLEKVKQISQKKSWITEGAWTSYAIELYKKADLVVFLEIPKLVLYKRILLRHFKRKFHKQKYKEHNLKTTFSILKKVNNYFNDPDYFMNINSHKEYINKYAKKSFTIKNNKDIKMLIEKLKDNS